MGDDITHEIELAYQKFCKIMGLKEATWGSINEFIHMVGMSVIYFEIRRNTPRYTEAAKRNAGILNGPNGETVIRAHKVRRYQPSGVLMAAFRKAAITGIVISIVGIRAFRDLWRAGR